MFNEYVKKEGNGQNVTMFLLYNIHNMIYCVQYVYHHLVFILSSNKLKKRDRILMYDGTKSIQMKSNNH